LVDIHFSFSPPCGNRKEPFAKREINILPVMNDPLCNFKYQYTNSSAHIDYNYAGFYESEASLLKTNELLEEIKKKIPGYLGENTLSIEYSLSVNNYYLFSKGYTTWSISC
jgi:hypothetical protein